MLRISQKMNPFHKLEEKLIISVFSDIFVVEKSAIQMP